MDYSSYYDVALNDFAYLEFNMSEIERMPEFNNVLMHEQQVCEKFLKHLVRLYVFDIDVDKVLKLHELNTLVLRIEKAIGGSLDVDRDMLRFLSDFYFDGRCPNVDFIAATKEDAIKGYAVTKQVKAQVDLILENYKPATQKIDLFD